MILNYLPENGFGCILAWLFWFCARLPNVIAFSDDPNDSNSVFFCGVPNVWFAFMFTLENVPKPVFGLPNDGAAPKAGAWPNTGDEAPAPMPKPVVFEPKPLCETDCPPE